MMMGNEAVIASWLQLLGRSWHLPANGRKENFLKRDTVSPWTEVTIARESLHLSKLLKQHAQNVHIFWYVPQT